MRIKHSQVVNKILKNTKKDKNVIYGAQSIKKQIGKWGRPTFDFDIMSKSAKKSAENIEKDLDKLRGKNVFYTKNWKAGRRHVNSVYWSGKDEIPNTKDDLQLADVTSLLPKTKKIQIEGVTYRQLVQELEYKFSTLKDVKKKRRWEKDRRDIIRIRKYFRNLGYNIEYNEKTGKVKLVSLNSLKFM